MILKKMLIIDATIEMNVDDKFSQKKTMAKTKTKQNNRLSCILTHRERERHSPKKNNIYIQCIIHISTTLKQIESKTETPATTNGVITFVQSFIERRQC